MIFASRFKGFDWIFFAAALALSAVGIMMIYSTGFAGSAESSLWIRQVFALGIGLAGMFFFSTLDYRFFRKTSSVIYLFSIFLLIAVLVVGQDIRGSRSCFSLGPLKTGGEIRGCPAPQPEQRS